MAEIKVGVLSCSGEEFLGGTIARLATRKVMEQLQPGKVVTLCLPLYIAGGDEERAFAKKYPVIAIEGCDKACVRRSTVKYSGDVADSVVISDIVGDAALSDVVSTRDLTPDHYRMIDQVAQAISDKVDAVLAARES